MEKDTSWVKPQSERSREVIGSAVPTGTKKIIEEFCLGDGETVSAYIKRLVDQDIRIKRIENEDDLFAMLAEAESALNKLNTSFESIRQYVKKYAS